MSQIWSVDFICQTQMEFDWIRAIAQQKRKHSCSEKQSHDNNTLRYPPERSQVDYGSVGFFTLIFLKSIPIVYREYFFEIPKYKTFLWSTKMFVTWITSWYSFLRIWVR